MKSWRSATTLVVAGAMLAGTAFAQTTTPSEPKAKEGAGAAGKSDTMKSDSMKSDPTMKGSGRTSGGAQRVKAVQQALKDKGHDPGAIDGKMGPKTQSALREFQSKEGLKASGRLDAETMAKLGVEAKGASAPSGTTTPSASPSGTTGATGSTGSGTTSGTKK